MKDSNTAKPTARIVGALFLIAMVTSLLGGGMIESLLHTGALLTSATENSAKILTGVYLELINGIAVVGIAVMMFPLIKLKGESLALGYISFRIMESTFCVIAAIIPLSIIALSREYLHAGLMDASDYKALGTLLISAREDLAGLLIPVFFSLGAILLYYFLYQSKFVPRFISIWGLLGVAMVLALNLLKFDINMGIVFALPMILNEIFLGIWLMVKGFRIEEG
jgi:hypothetical protein